MPITNQFEAIGGATKILMDHFVRPHLQTGKIDSNAERQIYNKIYGEITEIILNVQRSSMNDND